MANGFDKEWTTGEELRFINSLSVRGLEGYKQAFSLRGKWGLIKKSKVFRYLSSKGINPCRKNMASEFDELAI